MKSNLISKSETASILKKVSQEWKIELPKIKNLKVHNIEASQEIITGGGLMILHLDDAYLPFLSDTDLLEKFPSVTIDMGAVKFMCNGANVMRPGIKTHAEFEAGQIVCIIDESHQKFLAVGKAMMSSEDVESIDKGEVIQNMHYISDRFWEIGKTIRD